MTKYYAAVDEDGCKCIYIGMPIRLEGDVWEAVNIGLENTYIVVNDIHGFPKGLTWTDEPVEVELITSDELNKLKAEIESLWLELGKELQEK